MRYLSTVYKYLQSFFICLSLESDAQVIISKAMPTLNAPSSPNQNMNPDMHQTNDLEPNISGRIVQEEEMQKGVGFKNLDDAGSNRACSNFVQPDSLEGVRVMDEGHPLVESSTCDGHPPSPFASSKLVGDMSTGSDEANASCRDSEPTGGDPAKALENMGILSKDSPCAPEFLKGVQIFQTISSDSAAKSSKTFLVGNGTSGSAVPGTVCFYHCCSKCVSSLRGLMRELLVQEWGLKSNQWTVEDVHDAVASLSADLLSSLRKHCFTDYSSTKSCDFKGCSCMSSASNLNVLVECQCHPIGGHGVADGCSSDKGQPGLNAEFILRNGVLEPGNPNRDIDFHCKFETLCLCSLRELGVFTKMRNSDT